MRLLLIILTFLFTSCSKSQNPIKIISTTRTNAAPLQQLDYSGYTITNVYGNSWTDSTFVANGVSYNWIEMIKDSTGMLTRNKAVAGQGLSLMIKEVYDKMDTARSPDPVIVLVGFNNIRYTGATPEQIAKFKHGFRALLVNQFTDTMEYGGNLTFGGLWNSHNFDMGVHSKSRYATGGAKGSYTTYTFADNGSYREWSFTGSAYAIAFQGQDTAFNSPHGRTVHKLDAATVDTLVPYQQTEGVAPGYESPQDTYTAVRIYSTTPGSHTLRLEPLDASKAKFYDYVCTLRDPSLVAPVAILMLPYQTASGYLADPNFDLGSDAGMDAANNAIQEVIQEFITINPGYRNKIMLLPTNSWFNKNIHYGADEIHPTAIGYEQIYKMVRHFIIF